MSISHGYSIEHCSATIGFIRLRTIDYMRVIRLSILYYSTPNAEPDNLNSQQLVELRAQILFSSRSFRLNEHQFWLLMNILYSRKFSYMGKRVFMPCNFPISRSGEKLLHNNNTHSVDAATNKFTDIQTMRTITAEHCSSCLAHGT